MSKKMLIVLAPALLAAVPATAAPAPADSMVVSFGDLDLARADHRTILSQRLEQAAQTVCRKPTFRDRVAMRHYRACVDATLDAAERELAQRQQRSGAGLAAR